jgi:hypothetical protein
MVNLNKAFFAKEELERWFTVSSEWQTEKTNIL